MRGTEGKERPAKEGDVEHQGSFENVEFLEECVAVGAF